MIKICDSGQVVRANLMSYMYQFFNLNSNEEKIREEENSLSLFYFLYSIKNKISRLRIHTESKPAFLSFNFTSN